MCARLRVSGARERKNTHTAHQLSERAASVLTRATQRLFIRRGGARNLHGANCTPVIAARIWKEKIRLVSSLSRSFNVHGRTFNKESIRILIDREKDWFWVNQIKTVYWHPDTLHIGEREIFLFIPYFLRLFYAVFFKFRLNIEDFCSHSQFFLMKAVRIKSI